MTEEEIDVKAVQDAITQVEAYRKTLEASRLQREANLNPDRPKEDALKQLDSSVKRNTALIKKLRAVSEDSVKGVLEDISKVNQLKYVSEAVAAVAEAPLKVSDVPAALSVCCLLHQRYADFGNQIAPALAKSFSGKATSPDEERVLMRRRRSCLKLLADLMLAGVWTGLQPLQGMVQELATTCIKKDRETAQNSLSLLSTFAKGAREQILSLPPVVPLLPVPKELLEGQDWSGLSEELGIALGVLAGEQESLENEMALMFKLPEAESAAFNKYLSKAYEAASDALVEEHKGLKEAEVENTRIVNNRGDLPADIAAEYERKRKAFETLHRAVTTSSECLDKAMPELAEDCFTRLGAEGGAMPTIGVKLAGGGMGVQEDGGHVFEDQETRVFYSSMPDVKSLVPAVLLGLGTEGDTATSTAVETPIAVEPPTAVEDSGVELAAAAAEAITDGQDEAAAKGTPGTGPESVPATGKGNTEGASSTSDSTIISTTTTSAASAAAAAAAAGASEGVEDAAATTPAPTAAATTTAATSASAAAATPAATAATSAATASANTPAATAATTPAAVGPAAQGEEPPLSSAPSQIDTVLNNLPYCVSKDLCDEIAVNFCFMNSKNARRRLIRALCDVPRASLQLVPFYARIIAILAQVFPDVSQGVTSYLEEEFSTLMARKDPTSITLEPRIRNIRYLAELCKFKVYPPGSLFVALKQLLDDFTHHNIDAACALVETAGRFLIRTPETQIRMQNMLEVMMRLKNVKNLDPRRSSQVDGAYFAVKQPSKGAVKRKNRPPIQEYIRHLILVQLREDTVVHVLKKLVKVPWAESEKYILKCMMKVVRGRFTNIPLVTALAGGLAQYHESLGIAFVDAVLEDVRFGLENPSLGTYQKRMADVKLLGELYNYTLCNSSPIFETLYLLITCGHYLPPELAEKLDAPDDFFRVRMVCVLLETCGMYFNEGRARAKLDRYLTFFQAYVLSKVQPVPLDVEFDLQDVIHHLRPKMERYQTYEEALEAVTEIMGKEASMGIILGITEEEDDEDERRGGPAPEESSVDGGSNDEGDDDDDDSDDGGDGLRDSERTRRNEVDDDFEREYLQLLGESRGKAAGQAAAAPAYRPAVENERDGDEDEDNGAASMTFKMLMKRGGKRELQVPTTAALAVSLQQREEVEARDREEMKRLVLMASRQQEQEQMAIHRAQLRGYAYQGGQGGRGRGGGSQQQQQQQQQQSQQPQQQQPRAQPINDKHGLGLDYQSIPSGPRRRPNN